MASSKRSKAAPARRSGRHRARLPVRKRVVRYAVIAVLSLVLLFVMLVGALYAFSRIPEPSDIARVQSVEVVDREGKPVGRIHASADRVSIPLKEMPEHLREAVIAVEDRRFYSHPGVSVTSIIRAAAANAVGRGIRQGGSTITQQYVKNAFVGRERTLLRKTREAVLALKLERQRSKDEILELYLNTIYFGRGAYGVEAASRAYFGRQAKAVTLEQAALLAGLIKSPEAYDPVRDPDAARARRDTVLGLMRAQGYISDEEHDRATEAPVRARRRQPGGTAPHFLEEVRELLEKEIGPARLYSGNVKVESTLDLEMQRAAEDAVREVYDRKSDPEAALVSIDPKDGGVRAMVGARDFGRRQLNLATRGRQPGSTFKPFVLARAVTEGISPKDRFEAPASRTFQTDSGPWPVSNYDSRGHGKVTVARGTELSINTVYAQLILKVGAEDVAETSRRLGIRSKLDAVPSLTLGTSDVTPLEMANAYATLAARGEHRDPYMVRRVTSGSRVLYEADPESDRAIERNDADIVNHVLQGVIRDGTGRRAAIGRPAAGKTGTTENFRDAWFAGYTPDLATVVWNGYPQGGKKLRDVRGINVTGGSFPAEMWRRFMSRALEDVPRSEFATPEIEEGEDESSPSPSPTKSEKPTEEPTEAPPPPTKKPIEKPTATKTKKSSPTPSPSVTASPSPSQ